MSRSKQTTRSHARRALILAIIVTVTLACSRRREPSEAPRAGSQSEDVTLSATPGAPPTAEPPIMSQTETPAVAADLIPPPRERPPTGLDAALERARLSDGLSVALPLAPSATPIDATLHRALFDRTRARLASEPPRTRHTFDDGRPKYTNRLALSVSPYLLQHSHNPVNWFPWGEEAFALARALDRPVFLSVGYSTCHWCHVMEEESFEDVQIATYINEHFIPIKVDREQRPDVDDVYMTAVQAMTGRGGWPMTVVMLPDGRPFFGATYIPPRRGARGSRQGLTEILAQLVELYTARRDEVVADAAELSEKITRSMRPEPPAGMPDSASITSTAKRLIARFDHEYGGVGNAPKFPTPSVYFLLLRYHRRTGDAMALEVVTRTLYAMAQGGIYDQIGGGFHRYATDRAWLVPHFEKMLYDNAQLAILYLEAYQITGDPLFARIARETLDYVAREMTSPQGGFYSATDADSEGEEGLFFIWKPDELAALLEPDALAVVTAHYGVTKRGNFEGHNILSVIKPLDLVASELKMTPERAAALLQGAEKTLYNVRSKRIPPGLDDKIITAWNGLMIQAFARGARVLDEPAYRVHAEAAAAFLQRELWRDGELLRTFREGRAEYDAYLDDHAFLIAGLLELFELTAEPAWLEWSKKLQATLDARFADEAGGYFFTSDQHEALLVRQKPDYDGAEPSGNAIAAENLLKLAVITGEHAYQERGQRLLAAFGRTLRQRGTAHPRMLCALDFDLNRNLEVIIISPDPSSEATRALLAPIRERYGPSDVAMVVAEDRVATVAASAPPVAHKVTLAGAPTAYVCEAGLCETPTSDPEVLRQQLAAPRTGP